MIIEPFSRPVAHRGLFAVALPDTDGVGRGVENSMTAFQNAKLHGFAIECDVRLSLDGVPCIFHDDSLERLTDAKGLFREKRWEEIRSIELLQTRDCIPCLGDLLKLVSDEVPLVLELKSFDHNGWMHDLLLEKAVLKELEAFSKEQQKKLQISLKSFNPHTVDFLVSQRTPWPVGFLSCKYSADGEFGFLSQAEGLALESLSHPAAWNADFISYGIQDLSSELMKKVNKPFMAWTIRTIEQLLKARRLGATPVFEETVASNLLLI